MNAETLSEPVLVTGTAQDYYNIAIQGALLPEIADNVDSIIGQHNEQFGSQPERMIVLTELHSLMKTVKINIASLVKDISISVPFKSDFDHHYSLPHFNTDVALKEVRRIVRSLIVVRDFPLEALTTSISDAEFPLRVTNVLIKKAKLKFLYQLVLEDRNLPYNWKGLGRNSTNRQALYDCMEACGLEFLGPKKGVEFLKRDFRMQDFAERNVSSI